MRTPLRTPKSPRKSFLYLLRSGKLTRSSSEPVQGIGTLDCKKGGLAAARRVVLQATLLLSGIGPLGETTPPKKGDLVFPATKRSTNLNFWVQIFSGRVGVLHMKGWGPKSSVCPLKPGKSNFFGGISRNFAGISRRCPKCLRKKLVFDFWPL